MQGLDHINTWNMQLFNQKSSLKIRNKWLEGGLVKLQFKFVHSEIGVHKQILTSVRLSELLAENLSKSTWLAATAVF